MITKKIKNAKLNKCYNNGMYIHVKAKPGAKNETIVKKSETHFVISVKEPAERNLANKRIIEIISKRFCTNNVRIISGHSSSSKLLSVGN